MANSTPDSLGHLSRLPAEVRLLIFKSLLPDNFRQVYTVTDDGIAPDRQQNSPNPHFLRVSKQVHDEIVQAMMTDATCKVRIESTKITTNFIDCFRRAHSPQFGMTSFQLPACNMLDITIVPPFPRTTKEFVETRRNVQLFVEALNSATCDVLPKMSVRLEHQRNGGGFRCEYNDFAMLMGPLSKLQKRCRGVMIYRTTGWYSFAAKIEKQCDLVEKAVTGSKEASKLFTFQQRMLDIKLPLCMFQSEEHFLNRFDSQRQRAALDPKTAAKVLGGCCGLFIWSKTQKEATPQWLGALKDELMARRAPSATLLEQVFEGYDKGQLCNWAAGLMTPRNPFWKE